MTKEMSVKNIVLYADDDTDDLQLINEAFLQYSKNVELMTFSDGLQIFSHLSSLPSDEPTPCLIILDINMPRMDGKEALTKIRELDRFKDVPAILFTTSSQPTDKEFAKKLNAGFITKPIDFVQVNKIASIFIEHCSEEIQKKINKRTK